MDPLIQQRIGNYVVQRRLGRGGMGAVYLAENPQIRSRVAIKVLHAHHVDTEEVVKRFLGEARAVNLIGHPGIVRIYDCGSHPQFGLYLVMEYLDGATLQDRCKERLPLPPRVSVRYMLQTASALAASHRAGVVHRDLKPANIFITPDPDMPGGERVKILDFGIAKLGGIHQPLGGESMTGMMVGSPLYMSPEQLLDSKNVDARSDIYALGVIAYELLTGELPFRADTLGKLVLAQQNSPAPRPGERNGRVSAELDRVVLRALERRPEDRFQTMDELRTCLCDAAFHEPERIQPLPEDRAATVPRATPPPPPAPELLVVADAGELTVPDQPLLLPAEEEATEAAEVEVLLPLLEVDAEAEDQRAFGVEPPPLPGEERSPADETSDPVLDAARAAARRKR